MVDVFWMLFRLSLEGRTIVSLVNGWAAVSNNIYISYNYLRLSGSDVQCEALNIRVPH